MFERLRILALIVAVSLLTPALSQAQAHPTNATHRTPAPAAGPRLELTATAVRQHAQAVDSAAMNVAAARRNSMGRPVALMVVGGAAFLAGALIGGDAGTIFMIGGAVTALIGLYQYLE
jgi:hypothetical protein